MTTRMMALLFLGYSSVLIADAMLNERRNRANALLMELSGSDGPGVQYIIVDKDRVLYQHSSGLADIKNGLAMTASHTMVFFSITKTLTAIAVLQLVERGRISLDDSVLKYVKHPYGKDITIRQLLSHTAGIPSPIPLRWVHLKQKHAGFDELSELDRVLAENAELDSPAGENYSYSNIGYWLLGRLIENVTNLKYSEYMGENLFRPLGIQAQEFGFTIVDAENHAKGYLDKYSFMNLFRGFVSNSEIWGEYEGRWLHVKDVYVNGPSFGGGIGSVRALSVILQDLLAAESKILGSHAKKLLYTIQKTKSGETTKMTLGWRVGELNKKKYFFKQGGGAGFRSEMRVYPDEGLASVIVVNKTSFGSKKQLGKIDNVFIE